jgi:hypothetical protein
LDQKKREDEPEGNDETNPISKSPIPVSLTAYGKSRLASLSDPRRATRCLAAAPQASNHRGERIRHGENRSSGDRRNPLLLGSNEE